MESSTPLETIQSLLAARAANDLSAAVALYEEHALVVLQPGECARGRKAIEDFTKVAMSMAVTFGRRTLVETHDTALHISEWDVPGGDGEPIRGRSTDVLHRQPDGSWRIAIDNPWGVSLLDPTA